MKTKEYGVKINTKKQSNYIISLREKIEYEVIGQPRAIRRLLRVIAARRFKDPRRPIGGFIFAGPTGVGKTMLAKVFARYFLGETDKYKDYLTRIDGSTISSKYEISKLTGAPPGYVGYEDPPILLQENIDVCHFDIKARKDKACAKFKNKYGVLLRLFKDLQKRKSSSFYVKKTNKEQLIADGLLEVLYRRYKPYNSIVLFDEIEKAHKSIWNILLQIMEEGELQLGNGTTTNFSKSIIILTTNIGQRNIQEMLKGGIGFKGSQPDLRDQKIDQKIYKAVKYRIQKTFPPELFKRLDLVVFRPLQRKDFVKILDNFLDEERAKIKKQIRQTCGDSINIEFSVKTKRFLLKKGIDIHYGARTLRSVVEKYIRVPFANGLANGEIKPNDRVLIDEYDGELVFLRNSRKVGRKKIREKK